MMSSIISNKSLNSQMIGDDDNLFCFEDCSYSATGDFLPLDNGSFSILHINCRSLKKNLNHVIELLSVIKLKPSIIALTETWLQDGDEHFLSIPTYTILSAPRVNRRGGGVGFFVSNNVDYFVRTDVHPEIDLYESLTIEIECKITRNIVVTNLQTT
jgi:hypothetical protein